MFRRNVSNVNHPTCYFFKFTDFRQKIISSLRSGIPSIRIPSSNLTWEVAAMKSLALIFIVLACLPQVPNVWSKSIKESKDDIEEILYSFQDLESDTEMLAKAKRTPNLDTVLAVEGNLNYIPRKIIKKPLSNAVDTKSSSGSESAKSYTSFKSIESSSGSISAKPGPKSVRLWHILGLIVMILH